MRKPLIAANWKMYKTPQESMAFLEEFLPLVSNHTTSDISIFPAMTSLAHVIEATKDTCVTAGAQTMHWLNEGPYTGETSPTMLQSIGCTSVLIGHSERRLYAHETDETVNLKLKAALECRLLPVVCVGETIEKRTAGLTEAVLRWQIAVALNGVDAAICDKLVIAYEPVWAIGTGSVATPDQANDAHAIIRREIATHLGLHLASNIRILYGGSVKPDNVATLMAEPEIDGALVGGASLQPKSFAQIVQNATA